MKLLSISFLLLPALVLTSCLGPTALHVSGPIAEDRVWSGTVLIDGDVVVEEGARLTILPGSDVIFLPPSAGRERFTDHPHFPGSELIVKGGVVAVGTAEKPIVFRAPDPAGPAGSWGGINLVKTAQAFFRHCTFKQADSALHSQESTVDVACSTFERNLVGVRFHSSPITIRNNRFFRNHTAIRFHLGSPTIVHNDLIDNDKGIFVTSHPQGYRIEQNNIVSSRDAAVILGEEVEEDVPMAENYWGSGDPAAIEGSFFDGRRVDYLGKVGYRPFAVQPFQQIGPESCNP